MSVLVYVEIAGEKDGVYTALYRPETEDAQAGEISWDSISNTRTITRRSPDDNMDSSWYIAHAFVALQRMVSHKPIQREGISAWY